MFGYIFFEKLCKNHTESLKKNRIIEMIGYMRILLISPNLCIVHPVYRLLYAHFFRFGASLRHGRRFYHELFFTIRERFCSV